MHTHQTHSSGRSLANAFRTDPTRTGQTRARFAAEARRRVALLSLDVERSIVGQDCFGIVAESAPVVSGLATTGRRRFAFTISSRKLDGFMDWLAKEQRRGILEIVEGQEMASSGTWYNKYIQRAYGQGVTHGRRNLKRARYDVEAVEGVAGGLRGILGGPVHAERIAMLYGRTYEALRTVMDAANGKIREQLAEALRTGIAENFARGLGPKEVARALSHNVIDRLDKIARSRLEMIARTEVIRAHHVAMVSEYEQASKDLLVNIEAEWMTAGFNVCEICEQMAAEGPYTLRQVYDMIPAHPNCRCSIAPVVEARAAA